jgi:hypothetical protein
MRDITRLVGESRKAKIVKETAQVELVRARLAFCNTLISKASIAQPDISNFALACINEVGELKGPKPQTIVTNGAAIPLSAKDSSTRSNSVLDPLPAVNVGK